MERGVQKLKEYVDHLEIWDTHEHLPSSEAQFLDESHDLVSELFKGYVQHDLCPGLGHVV